MAVGEGAEAGIKVGVGANVGGAVGVAVGGGGEGVETKPGADRSRGEGGLGSSAEGCFG